MKSRSNLPRCNHTSTISALLNGAGKNFNSEGVPGHIPGGGVGGNNFIMQESRLEQNGTEQYLIVYYDKRLDDFNDAIETALLKHKLEPGECPVLCLPGKAPSCGSKT